MKRLSRKNLEIFYIFVGVIAITSGITSIAREGFEVIAILYLILGFYLIAVSTRVLRKVEASKPAENPRVKVTSNVTKKVEVTSTRPKTKAKGGKNGKKA
jgi:membrane protein implicated in regulation of membrane protease activity